MTGSRSTAALLRTAMGRPRGCPDLPGDHDWVVSTEQRILRTQEPTMAKTYRAVHVSKAGLLRSSQNAANVGEGDVLSACADKGPSSRLSAPQYKNFVFDGLASMDKTSAAEWAFGEDTTSEQRDCA